MFEIEYKGGNTVLLTTKKAGVVFDPKLSLLGLKDLAPKDSIQVVTEERFLVDNDSFRLVFDGPGEYEVADVSLKGVPAKRHIDADADTPASTVYRADIDGVKVAILGNIAPTLTDQQLEDIGLVDIAVVPVGGGGYTLDATAASTLVRQLEPKVVIPIHYSDNALKYEVPQDTLEVFTGELGAPVEDGGSKYKLKSASALPQVMTVIKLDRS